MTIASTQYSKGGFVNVTRWHRSGKGHWPQATVCALIYAPAEITSKNSKVITSIFEERIQAVQGAWPPSFKATVEAGGQQLLLPPRPEMAPSSGTHASISLRTSRFSVPILDFVKGFTNVDSILNK